MYLETERLVIRSIHPDDERDYVKMAADGSLTEDIFSGFHGACESWMGEWIRDSIRLDQEDDPGKEYLAYSIVEKARGVVVGSVGCSYFDDLGQVGITYFVGTDSRGKGCAAEAARAYAQYFLQNYAFDRLLAVIRSDNTASCKTAERAGFTLAETRWYQDVNDGEEKLYRFYVRYR